MIMKILGFDMEIDINNEKTNILLISDSKLFGRICFDLTRNNDENIVFVLDNKIVNMKDILIISDIMNFDINNKMIISKLYNQMSNSLLSDSDIENEIKKHYIEIVKKVYDEVDNYNVDINLNEELDFIKLFKMMCVEIHNSYDCLVNKIIDLLEIYSELCNQTIVFINTLNYFSNEEINEVLKYIDYKKISVLFLENSYNKDVYFENKYIIDDEFYDYIVHNNKK
ncbi:type II-A CRISPR-associated protein Csn2 [Faecalibacillus faecis]|mgnify:FL=1|uniref:type II-A CRISPR-associated protein Csn2 n=1 Tax=Faecalibacillus faecis TaxID=1982628 RepID=UPI002F93573E